jgi:hypothetical protein
MMGHIYIKGHIKSKQQSVRGRNSKTIGFFIHVVIMEQIAVFPIP